VTLAGMVKQPEKYRWNSISGIIGSREFVSASYRRFKHLFVSKHKKIPKPI
jgi:hypothetical protein